MVIDRTQLGRRDQSGVTKGQGVAGMLRGMSEPGEGLIVDACPHQHSKDRNVPGEPEPGLQRPAEGASMSGGLLGPRLKRSLCISVTGPLGGAVVTHSDQLPAPHREFIKIASRTAARDFWL